MTLDDESPSDGAIYAAVSERLQLKEMAALRTEIERLQELLRSEGANRYWEGRWRDEKAENERLRAIIAKIAWHNAQNGQDALNMRSIALDEMRRVNQQTQEKST